MVTERNSRKRQRSPAASIRDAEEDGRKQRGRPRVEGADETAADRRRTQIRLAQRAYRQRKETTIASLKDQVSSLQATIEEMNKAFLQFNDKAVGSGALQSHPDVARHLKNATEQFILLAKSAGSQSSDGDSANSDQDAPTETQNILSAVTAQLPPRLQPKQNKSGSVDIGMGYLQVFDDSSDSMNPTFPEDSSNFYDNGSGANNNVQVEAVPSIEMGNPFVDTALIPGATNGNNSLFDFTTSPDSMSLTTTNATSLNSGLPSPSPMPLIPSPMKTITVTPPYTFSLEETTLSRRLHRAALERGFHLLSTASLRPAAFRRVFRLSLLYNSPDTLLHKFRSILSNGVGETLEFYQTPFIHLGGAGTHYSNGRVKNAFFIKPGPNRPVARLQNAENGADAGIEVDFDVKEYEGVWFDSNDVEGYLQEKGIQINPQNSFSEIHFQSGDVLSQLLDGAGYKLPAALPSPAMTSVTNLTSPEMSVFNDDTLDFSNAPLFPDIQGLDNGAWANNAAGWLLGSGDRTPDFLNSGWVDIQQPSAWDGMDVFNPTSIVPDSTSTAPSNVASESTLAKRRYRMMIDVSKLVDELIKTGICLGRGPGFRRRDVDRALTASIIQVV